jgi:tetratricopeptide (TPR) repeat protein
MPLQGLLYRQVAELSRFFDPSETRLWILRLPGDLRPVVGKILVGLQDDADNTNVFFHFGAPFSSAEQYFAQVLQEFEAELDGLRSAFAGAGVMLPARGAADGSAALRLARRGDAVAEAFPEKSGSLVFVLDPGPVPDSARFAAALADLADQVRSPRSKYLLLDVGASGELDRLRSGGGSRCGGQDFRLSPDVIERQVRIDLEGDSLAPSERRQYLGMAAAFAFAHGRLDEAVATQHLVLKLVEEAGAPGELAPALYALGGTHLKVKANAEAERCFVQAADDCLSTGNDTLLAMVLIHLGVALYRQGKTDEALQSLEAGRQTFRALNHPTGEVHALDTRAALLAEAGQRDAAEQTWQEALRRADDINVPDLPELRDSCRQELAGKVRRPRRAETVESRS